MSWTTVALMVRLFSPDLCRFSHGAYQSGRGNPSECPYLLCLDALMLNTFQLVDWYTAIRLAQDSSFMSGLVSSLTPSFAFALALG